jgi:Phosphotransferase enzyme family
LISHRPSTLERCEGLLVLDHGRVVTDTSRPITLAPLPAPAPTERAPAADRSATIKSHPAVRAWCQLHPHAAPAQITPLRTSRRKSAVYRLVGAGRGGSPVIAKRSRTAAAQIERTVYEGILPRLAVPSLRYEGFVPEPDDSCWLFMEEATGSAYSNLLAEHRVRAGRWLGLLHSAAADVADGPRLPEAGPGRYLPLLQRVRAAASGNLDNPVLSPDDLGFLEGLVARLDDVAAHWDRLEAICHGVPQTLVHGDFNGRNIRLRGDEGDATVVVFDWEESGWGVPAVDLAQQLTVQSGQLSANADIPAYWAAVRERWPAVSLEACRRLAYCGTVFRAAAAMSWITHNLANDGAHACLGDMRLYAAELESALKELNWAGLVASPPREVAAT